MTDVVAERRADYHADGQPDGGSAHHKRAHFTGSLELAMQASLKFAGHQFAMTAASLPPHLYPEYTAPTGSWVTTSASRWTSGFFPGALWLMYEFTGDRYWLSEAESRQAGIEPEKWNGADHDLGFKLLTSFGNGYRLTGNDAYRRVLLRAAESLASRFNPVVGATRSRGGRCSSPFTVIVDNLMNLELLFWAAKHGGDPAWHAMALTHALRSARDHMRADGSTFHAVDFGPGSGHVTRKRTLHGFGRSSTWSRGQAWAVHGFTMAFRETGHPRLRNAAHQAADWLIKHLPHDKVPYWDFGAPGIPYEPRDSSSAAIAASGLLELASLETDPTRAPCYRAAAEEIITSLSSDGYLARGHPTQAILLHGTKSYPGGSYDTGLIYGDFYLLEALRRNRRFPARPARTVVEVDIPRGARDLTTALKRGLHAILRSEAPGSAHAALLVRRNTARRLGWREPAAAVIGRASTQLAQPGTEQLVVRIASPAAERLGDLPSARLMLSVVFAAADGLSAAATIPVTLRRD